MCFSAGASFGAGAVLGAIGIAAIKRSCKPSQIAFACIPLIFAAQQFTEGLVWLSLTNPVYSLWGQPATYIFLVCAQVIWPIWVPFSILLLENDKYRKRLLLATLSLGLLVSFYLAWRLGTQNIYAEINGMHISYVLGAPVAVLHYSAIAYFIATVLPSFISTVKRMQLFGFSIMISYAITLMLFKDYQLSVWCFFAAVISILVFSILFDLDRSFKENKPLRVLGN
jgi:hypothetical protein